MTHLEEHDIDAPMAEKLAEQTSSEEDRLIAEGFGASAENRQHWSNL